jgi:uncharacterized membrane protein SpoIIM required for sporulation
MFDILFSAKKAERHPVEMIFVAFFYASVSILIGSWIFPEYASLLAVFFTVTSCLYVAQGAIKRETVKEEYYGERRLLEEHKGALVLFMALFIGIVIAFSFWTYILPVDKSSELFSIQETVLAGIRGQVTGNAISSGEIFSVIFNNNLKVLTISLIVSLIYGAGAMFILTWNASIMGFVIGSIAKDYGAVSFPAAFLKYFLHGLPEMLSYFVVILAGGIVYTALLRGDFSKRINARRIILDVIVLILGAVVLMAFAAVVEVWVSPLI